MPEAAALRFESPSVFRMGLLTALLVFLADQATKLGLLFGYRIAENGPIRLTSFLDIVEVWNRGISYGLLQQDSWFGRWLLIVLSVFAAGLFALWLWRTASRLTALALGLIIGGALGNVVDRAAYGAVFDFVHLHIGAFSWYVFNIADAAIVAGVIGLLYESMRPANAQSPV